MEMIFPTNNNSTNQRDFISGISRNPENDPRSWVATASLSVSKTGHRVA